MVTIQFTEFVQNGQTFDLPAVVLLKTVGKNQKVQSGVKIEFSKNPGGVFGSDVTDQNGNARKIFSGLLPGQSYILSAINAVNPLERIDESVRVPTLPPPSLKPIPAHFSISISRDRNKFLLIAKVLDEDFRGVSHNVILYVGIKEDKRMADNGQVSFQFSLKKGEKKTIIVTPEGYGKHSIKRNLRGK